MADNLYTNNIILIKKIFIREDTVNDIGLDILGKISIAGDIFPTVDQTYSLGSSNIAWKDIYIETGSLYINNKKIISDESNTINISTNINKNLKFKTSGTGILQFESDGLDDIILTTTSGNIKLKGTIELLSTKKIISSDGNDIKFGNGITLDAGKNITLSGGGEIIGASLDGWKKNGNTIFYNNNVGFGITNPLDTIHSSGAIIISNSNVASPGSIRWTGDDFEGKKNGDWVSLTSLLPSANNNNITNINGLYANGNIEVTGTFTKNGVNGGADLISQISTNKTDIALKANQSLPTFIGTVTGENFIMTGTLKKNTGDDLLAQIATNKVDITTEKSRVDVLLLDQSSNRILLTNIETAYKAADIGVSTTLTSLQSQHNSDISNLNSGKQTQGVIDSDLIPDQDNEYDIGSPEFMVKDVYVAENSIWFGDKHKIGMSDGKLKFRKRKTNKIPKAFLGNKIDVDKRFESDTTSFQVGGQTINLADMKLKHWQKLGKTDDRDLSIGEIFTDDESDYEEVNDITEKQPKFVATDDNDGMALYFNNGVIEPKIIDSSSLIGSPGATGQKGENGVNGGDGQKGQQGSQGDCFSGPDSVSGHIVLDGSGHNDYYEYVAVYIKNEIDDDNTPLMKLYSAACNASWYFMLTETEFCFNLSHTSDGDFRLTSDGALLNPSDRRVKKNIEYISGGFLDKAIKLKPVRFEYIDKYYQNNDPSKGKKILGLIAQEVEEVFPNLISKTSSGLIRELYPNDDEQCKSLCSTEFGIISIAAIKELKAKYDEVITLNDNLKSRVLALEKIVGL